MVNNLPCAHQHCGLAVSIDGAMWREGKPFHTYCYYAHPDYDVSKREGSPFTTIHRQEI